MAAFDKYFGVALRGGAVAKGGSLGVDLFFLISGFIIAIVSLKGADLAPAIEPRDFFLRRFTRIVPLMWVAILSFAVLALGARGVWHGLDYVRALLLLPWGRVQPPHLWTLRQEWIFYAVFAAAMLTRRRWRFLVVVWAFGWLAAGFLDPFVPNPIKEPFRLLFNPCNFEFFAGLALAALWLRRTKTFKIRLPVDPLLVLAGCTLLLMGGITASFERWSVFPIALLFMPLLFLAVHVECPTGPLRRLGETLGNASYSIYLFHPPIVAAQLGLWAKLLPGTPVWLVVAGCALVSAGVCVVLHFVLERPLVAVTRRWLQTKRTPAPVF